MFCIRKLNFQKLLPQLEVTQRGDVIRIRYRDELTVYCWHNTYQQFLEQHQSTELGLSAYNALVTAYELMHPAKCIDHKWTSLYTQNSADIMQLEAAAKRMGFVA